MSADCVHRSRSDLDARSIVPISDEMGGISVYVAGQPAYYILNGEWFEAVSVTREKKSVCDIDRSIRVF